MAGARSIGVEQDPVWWFSPAWPAAPALASPHVGALGKDDSRGAGEIPSGRVGPLRCRLTSHGIEGLTRAGRRIAQPFGRLTILSLSRCLSGAKAGFLLKEGRHVRRG